MIDVVSLDGVSVRMLSFTNRFGFVSFFSPHLESVTSPTGSP